MNITELAIKHNRISWTLLFVVVLFGINAYKTMPKDYDPGFILRTAQVITQFPGASPQRVEQLITDKLEKEIQELPELDFVSSESRTGISIISVNIKESYKNMRPIWDKLRRKVDAAKEHLPAEAHTPTVNDEFGDVFGIVVGFTAEGFSYQESKVMAKQVKDAFLRLPEAAKVDIFGEQQQQIYIEYNNARLSELGLSPSQLKDQVASRNTIIPGGSINLNNEKISLEPTGNFESVNDIRKTIVQVPGSDQVIYLSDIANVYRGYKEPAKSLVSINGQQGLTIAISMKSGGNNIELGKQVLTAINELTQLYPIGVEFEVISFLPQEVEDKVNEFANNLVQAVAVVTLVMLLTLGVKTGFIVAALIPLSMVAGILVMSFFDIGIDQISLAALIIALGMLVDNGIVMAESILVRINKGQDKIEAAVRAANELKVPLLTSSLTTAAAFLPIFLAESTTSEYTASLFKVVAITLLCSWLLAMTIIPMLCVYFMKAKPSQADVSGPIYEYYRNTLTWCLNNRWLTITITAVVLFIALSALKYVPKLFFPPSDRHYFKVEIELPTNTRIERSQYVAKQIEGYIEENLKVSQQQPQGVTSWVTYVGSGGPRFLLTHNPKANSSNYALLVINVTDDNIIDALSNKIEDYAFDQFPDAIVKSKKIENGAPIANPVEVRISGTDGEQLMTIMAAIKQQLATISGVKNISDNWGLPIKKLQVTINQARARRAGVSSKDIAISLQTGLTGLELTQYREGDESIPVIMRSQGAEQQDINKLESLAVYSQASGSSVPLKQVADVEVVWQAASILRRDRLKTITIGAQVDASITATDAFNQIIPWLEQQNWPLGYQYQLGGEMESSGKANQSIAEKLPIAVLIIVLLLVGQFNSARKSLIILTTIPLSLIGVVVGLLAGGSFFGFMTLLGMISLAGIVINNAIVLLERIKIENDSNLHTPTGAIITASLQRIRPILLTTATTIMGLVPLYLGGGLMWEPMALAIMGGLLFSTVLTLCVIPVLYAVLFNVTKD